MSESEGSQKPANPLKKIGIGLAVVAIPVSAAVGVWQFKQAEDKHNDDLERGFKYDDAALKQVDPKLIGYQEAGQIATGMARPTCIAAGPDGRIYVGGDRQVKVLDAKGGQLAAFPILGEATAIAASGDAIYVALGSHLEVYTSSGTLKNSWTSLGVGSYISSIAVGGQRVYLADSGLKVGHVWSFDLEGNRLGEIAKQDTKASIPGILTPSPHMDVALTAEGNLWVANPGHHQLELYSPAGELIRAIGQSGTSIDQFIGCCNPSDFALLSDGRLVTAEKGIARVKVYQPDGHFVNVVAAPDNFTGNRQGLDLATDLAGRVLVLEPGTTAIRVFTEKAS